MVPDLIKAVKRLHAIVVVGRELVLELDAALDDGGLDQRELCALGAQTARLYEQVTGRAVLKSTAGPAEGAQ